jgi:acetoacetyl-CoA synthetase
MEPNSPYFSASVPCWQPTRPGFTRSDYLREFINRRRGLRLADYYALHKYSVEDYNFWIDLWDFLGVISSIPPDPKQILAKGILKEIPIWFPSARLNYAENLLRRQDDGIACTVGGESLPVRHHTYRQLRAMVQELAAALRVNGLVAGDRVAGIITNSIHAVAIALAATSIGAIYSGTATDMGAQGILHRYGQIQPKFVFAETEVSYSGKTIDLLPKVSEVVGALIKKGLKRVILLPSAKSGHEISSAAIGESLTLSEFLATGDNRPLEFEQLPFSHPLFILYSSGTSGPPKCIVHCAGGVLLQTTKDIALGLDVTADDTYFQYTTTGWMMWSFMLSALFIGSRIILYDGSPFYPSPQHFLKFIDQQGVTTLGTSPRFLGEVQGRGIDPLKLGSFNTLRTIGCTGAVLTHPIFAWAQKAFGERVHLISTSGGTDVCASFVTGAPSLPVYVGEIQCKTLGMKIEVFDPEGRNIEETGEPGELVCTRPHPSLPLKFWGDETGEKLRKAYYDTYSGTLLFSQPQNKSHRSPHSLL